MKISDQQPYDLQKKRFINPHIQDEKRSLKDFLHWKTGRFEDRTDLPEIPAPFHFPLPSQGTFNPLLPKAQWINHSTFLIECEGIRILTDPIWSRRCSPFPFLGPTRRHEPALSLVELPKIDHVFISHNHYDHLDKRTIIELHLLHPSIQWWVPLGVKKWFQRLGIEQVEELGWWESASRGSFLRATAVPSQHFSGRGLLDKGKTLWAGWVIEFLFSHLVKRLYFVGDTGYNEVDFKSIGKKWPFMDLSLIPIGTYVPRRFMSPVHIEPKHAVEIHKEVHSRKSIGMHWRTFHLSEEEGFRPPYDLFLQLQKHQIDPISFLALPPGYEINW